jgi:hypothetical protein
MSRWVTAALALTLVCAMPLAAADEVKKPTGTWTKKAGEITVTFTIKGDGLTVSLKGDGKIEATADYGVSKDGVLFGRISKVTKEGIDGGPEEGDLFSFRFKVEKDKLTISELTAAKTSDEAKKLVEGDYEKQNKDNK